MRRAYSGLRRGFTSPCGYFLPPPLTAATAALVGAQTLVAYGGWITDGKGSYQGVDFRH